MGVRLLYRPQGQWTDPITDDDERTSSSGFKGDDGTGSRRPTPLHRTEQLLRTEAQQLDASECIIELDVPSNAIRSDESGLRGDRRTPDFPGVVVRLVGTRFGDLRYACDEFTQRWSGDMPGWEANLRAIALGLQALRKVERYGIARRGEQYRGWGELPPGTVMGTRAERPPMTLDEAARVLAAVVDGMEYGDVLADVGDARTCYRLAAKRLHPDNPHTGNAESFRRLDEAWQLISAHHGAS